MLCLCVYKYVCVMFMSVYTGVCVYVSLPGSVHLVPCLDQSPFAVCTLIGLWASGDTYMSTCSQGGSTGVADPGFCVGSADLNLGLCTEPPPQAFISSF